MGRWGLSPLPRQTGLKFVIGQPLEPPEHTPGQQVHSHGASQFCDMLHMKMALMFQQRVSAQDEAADDAVYIVHHAG